MTTAKKGHPILVPVDFSPSSEAALLSALELAEKLACPLVVLHVVHDLGQAPGYYAHMKGRKKQIRRMEDVASEMLEDFIADLRRKHKHATGLGKLQTMMAVGLPVTRVLEAAEKIHARMIVMGSMGRTGLSHVLLGSKAEQIVRLAPIPVLIVKEKKQVKTEGLE